MSKILNYLGIARRAGFIVMGTDAVLDNLQYKKIKMIFLANDSSVATIEKVGIYYHIPVIKKYSTDELSKALGAGNIKVIGIKDPGIIKAIKVELERGDL